MDFEQARSNMITQQMRTNDVLDQRILDALSEVPREEFVPESLKNLAFADTALEIGHGQSMLLPQEEGEILQALQVQAEETVLLVGTGTGFLAALFGKLAKQVYAIDNQADFTDQAQQKLNQLNLHNVKLITADGSQGWQAEAPYDVICITGSLPNVSELFLQQLNLGGRLFAITGKAPAMQAVLITHTADDNYDTKALFETVVPRLSGVSEPEQFEF